jgi:site-specific DNA recombinase
MTRDQIASIITTLGDIPAVLKDADPADKAEIYSQLGLRLTYRPGQRIVWTRRSVAPLIPNARVVSLGT